MLIVDNDGNRIATVVNCGWSRMAEKVNFVTEESDPLQVGVLNHKAGTVLEAHAHNSKEVGTVAVMEVIYVVAGSVRVTFYDDKDKVVATKQLIVGDLLVQYRGGHGFSVLKECRMIEVKQGPYGGKEKDKRMIAK